MYDKTSLFIYGFVGCWEESPKIANSVYSPVKTPEKPDIRPKGFNTLWDLKTILTVDM